MFTLPVILSMIIKYGPQAISIARAAAPIVADVVKALTPGVEQHARDGLALFDQVDDLLGKLGHPAMTAAEHASFEELQVDFQAGGR